MAKSRYSTKHPYAAIEHRVIDSEAFASLKPTAKVLLFLLARQLTKDNNGHLQATFKWCSRYGIGSTHTLRDAIDELVRHGLIYRTRSHGANGAWARYALTWLPIKRSEGLFLTGFEPFAWRDWTQGINMTNGKSTPQKLQEGSCKKCSFTPKVPAESAGNPTAKTADYELIPCSSSFSTKEKHNSSPEKLPKKDEKVGEITRGSPPEKNEAPKKEMADWIGSYVERLKARGLIDFCSVTYQYPTQSPPVAISGKHQHQLALNAENATTGDSGGLPGMFDSGRSKEVLSHV